MINDCIIHKEVKMGLFGKKKSAEENVQASLPDLPEFDDSFGLPSINDLEPVQNIPELETNALPQLPQNNFNNGQDEIKSVINRPVIKQMPRLPEIPRYGSNFQVVETSHPDVPVKVGYGAIETIPPSKRIQVKNRGFVKSPIKEAEPIYVRLDKFQITVNVFEEIKNKVGEIDKLLSKIKEIREKEDRELDEWENEIQAIKSRIESVDRNIFDKLD